MYRNIGKVLSKNSPAILTGLGVTGVLATAVLAVRHTPTAMELLSEKREEIGGDLSVQEIIGTTW